MNRVRAALLRLAPPWRRRHPVVLATVERVSIRSTNGVIHMDGTGDNATTIGPVNWRATANIERLYAAERDPTDEAGA